ncbi:hypothetical protein FS842_007500 [Serendipita sp. 407]|nr:hypothetical protein FS842_007500 [Serendipita sp. 407]
MYDWVAQNPNIIAVSMNYRLHLFGFLDGTAVRADGTPNAGLLDQRAAIEWVRRHISQFGGDPDQITIAGESAGGASVVLQATAYGGVRQAPFKRAIAQSIGLYPLPLDSEIEGVFRNVTTAASCPTEGAEAMACLRSAPLSTLIKSINSVRTNFLAPTIDGKNGFLPDLPSKMIREIRASNPYMGAMHASDVYYMFNGATGTVPFFAPFNATEVPVSQEIIGYWTSFTETGDPSKHKMPFSPAWPNFTGTRRVVMREDLSGNGTRTASFVERIPVGESTRCKWWMSQNETRV